MPAMSIAYQVRRTGRRSKNISVRVHYDGTVRVGAPTWASRNEIHRVVNLHAQWIAEQVAEARALAPRYDDGALHFFMGKRYPLAFESPAGRDEVAFTGRRILVATDDRDAPSTCAICCVAGIASSAQPSCWRQRIELVNAICPG